MTIIKFNKYLIPFLLLFVFQIIFFQITADAFLPPSVVANDELKQCTWFGGSADKEYVLPDGWSYVDKSCDIYCCREFGYEIVDIDLKEKKSFYGYVLMFYRIIFFVVLGVIIFSLFNKIKKETILAKFIIILFCLLLSLYMATLLYDFISSL